MLKYFSFEEYNFIHVLMISNQKESPQTLCTSICV